MERRRNIEEYRRSVVINSTCLVRCFVIGRHDQVLWTLQYALLLELGSRNVIYHRRQSQISSGNFKLNQTQLM
jgi:hypothetical protein